MTADGIWVVVGVDSSSEVEEKITGGEEVKGLRNPDDEWVTLSMSEPLGLMAGVCVCWGGAVQRRE